MVVRGRGGGSGDEELLMRSRSGRLWVIWAFEFHRRMGATACVSQTHTGSMAGARILERPSPSRLVCRWARNDARPFRGCSGGGMGGSWQDAKYFMIIGPDSVGSGLVARPVLCANYMVTLVATAVPTTGEGV